jgi:uncharacterized SAM-binding protein YcdF (DUF218 family)
VKLLANILYILSLVIFACTVAMVANFLIIPNHNTDAIHFDTLIVLGYPTNPDGSSSPELRERVLEGVREFKAGIAPHLIMTGAAAHNDHVEAYAMAQLAVAQGVPANAILEEPQAHNTIQNLLYSAQIMHDHNWGTAEIISSPSHLPRAAVLVDNLNRQQPNLSFNWHTHAARWPPEYGLHHKFMLYFYESWSVLKLRFNPPNMKLPSPAH